MEAQINKTDTAVWYDIKNRFWTKTVRGQHLHIDQEKKNKNNPPGRGARKEEEELIIHVDLCV